MLSCTYFAGGKRQELCEGHRQVPQAGARAYCGCASEPAYSDHAQRVDGGVVAGAGRLAANRERDGRRRRQQAD